MFSLIDADTARVLRALSLAGPTAADTLALRLQLREQRVRVILSGALDAGVVHAAAGADTSYRVDAAALAAVVRQQRDDLLGAAA